jgi:hypothetical protein
MVFYVSKYIMNKHFIPGIVSCIIILIIFCICYVWYSSETDIVKYSIEYSLEINASESDASESDASESENSDITFTM